MVTFYLKEPYRIIATALEIIVEQNGINLKSPLNDILDEQGVVADCHKHIYESKGSSISIRSNDFCQDGKISKHEEAEIQTQRRI